MDKVSTPLAIGRYNFSASDLQRVFLTSDHHFGHKNVIQYCDRPFASVEEMNEALIKSWNRQVSPSDLVIYVGDFSLSVTAVESVLRRLNGTKNLVVGNHDWAHRIHKGWRKKRERYVRAGFGAIYDEAEIRLLDANTRFHVAHLPYRFEGVGRARTALARLAQKLGFKKHVPDDRYPDFRPKPDRERYTGLICGHTHGAWLQKGDMFNVGIDAAPDFKLWTLGDVVYALSTNTDRVAKAWSGRP